MQNLYKGGERECTDAIPSLKVGSTPPVGTPCAPESIEQERLRDEEREERRARNRKEKDRNAKLHTSSTRAIRGINRRAAIRVSILAAVKERRRKADEKKEKEGK